MPKVTILMPVYNGENYLRESIESILYQTFTDFEFLIIDDGSTDQSVSIIKSYDDPRIRLKMNKMNQKLSATLNKGIASAKGKYIARMDCDDISFASRLEKQVDFMDKNPEIGVCGTAMKIMLTDLLVEYPSRHDDIKCRMLFSNSFSHPTLMYRKSVLNKYGLYYDTVIPYAQDYDLCWRMAKVTMTANIQEPLLYYRIHDEQVSFKHRTEQQIVCRNIVLQQLYDLGIEPSDEEFSLHMSLFNYSLLSTEEYVQQVRDWFDKLINTNTTTQIYSRSALEDVVLEYLYEVEKNYFIYGPKTEKRENVDSVRPAALIKEEPVIIENEQPDNNENQNENEQPINSENIQQADNESEQQVNEENVLTINEMNALFYSEASGKRPMKRRVKRKRTAINNRKKRKSKMTATRLTAKNKKQKSVNQSGKKRKKHSSSLLKKKIYKKKNRRRPA